MPKEKRSKYFWPASAITQADMALLHRARELSPGRQPITRLLARAVRESFGYLEHGEVNNNNQLKEAA